MRVDGDAIVDAVGAPVLLRGVGLGGWMNMENFITGYPANESAMRAAVRGVLGAERADALLRPAARPLLRGRGRGLLAALGVNCVRLPVNYRHFERDARPFELLEEGFERLDARRRRCCGAHGIYSVIDLHAVPGCAEPALALRQPDPRRRVLAAPALPGPGRCTCGRRSPTRFAGNPWVAGYNLLNEPADPTGAVVGPFHDRLVAAIREIDPEQIVFGIVPCVVTSVCVLSRGNRPRPDTGAHE